MDVSALWPPAIALVLLYVVQRQLAASRPQQPTAPPLAPTSHWLWVTSLEPRPWLQYTRWARQCGELVRIRIGPGFRDLIVVNSVEGAKALLETHASITSNRPRTVFAGETMSGDCRILLLQHGPRWQKLRKMLHAWLQPKQAAAFEATQAIRARGFIKSIFSDPDQFLNHAKSYAASVILTFAYGKTSPTLFSDPDVREVNECLERLGKNVRPGLHLVDSFPILSYFPFKYLGSWRAKARAWHKQELSLFTRQLDTVRAALKDGKGMDCFGRHLLEHQKEFGMSDAEAAYSAGSMFGAGADTTASALGIVIMAAVLHPAATELAQQELDRVVGRSRPPGFEDVQDLLYVEAFIKETYRWRPVSPAGFTHATTKAIAYKNYLIPRGTMIQGCHWAIGRDPLVFPDGDTFRPERWFVDENVKSGVLRTDLNHTQWGFGRRVCAGKNVAQRSVYINTALLLWSFKFSFKKAANGTDIPIDSMGFTDSANSHPLPFACQFDERFAGVRRILEGMDDAE